MKIFTDILTLFFLPGWIVIYTFLLITNFPIIFEKKYLYENIVITFRDFLMRYILLPFKIPKAFKARHQIADVIHLFTKEGLPYLWNRSLSFSISYG